MFKIMRKTRTPNRDGISIIEVLTSMAVATIGVFGVMVMIPFAVKQSQSGLDSDAANSLGRNVVEELQIGGTLRASDSIVASQENEVLPGMFFEPVMGSFFNYNLTRIGEGFPAGGTPLFNFPGSIHFDPIGFTAPSSPAPSVGLTQFTIDPAGDNITVFSANATQLLSIDANGNGLVDIGERAAFTIREASRMCRSRDVLFFETDSDLEVAPPQPLFDMNGGNEVKRQSSGRISWSVFLTPEKDPTLTTSPANRFRTHTLVYRDRFISTTPADRTVFKTSIPFDEEMRGSCYDFYQTNMQGTGPVRSVSQITFAGNVIDTEELFRGDWVMLINRIPLPATADVPLNGATRAADNGYRIQTMFARVIRVGANSVTIDGGSFDFVPSGIGGVGGSSETYMVHLKDVVNVFERSVSVER